MNPPGAKTGAGARFDSIQILRGVAALMVLLFHIPFFLKVPAEPGLPILNGGVDLFFVISGFIMVVSTAGRRERRGAFARRRLQRIVPLYWLFTLVTVVVFRVVDGIDYGLRDILASLFFVPFLNEPLGLVQPILSVGWTLNLEMLFYVLFLMTLGLAPAIQTAAVALAFAGLIALRALLAPAPNSVLFFYTSPMLLEFSAGMALALVAPRLQRWPAEVGALMIGAGIAGLLVMGLWFHLPRTLALGLPAWLVCAGALTLEARRRLGGLGPLRHLGDASYSLYLSHHVVLGLLMPVLVRLPWTLAFVVSAAVCLLVAVATYAFVERPLTALVARRKPRRGGAAA